MNLKIQLILNLNSSIKKLGGYIMGNFGINQGPLGLKLYSLIFIEEFVNYFEKITSKKLNSFDLNYGGNLVYLIKVSSIFILMEVSRMKCI